MFKRVLAITVLAVGFAGPGVATTTCKNSFNGMAGLCSISFAQRLDDTAEETDIAELIAPSIYEAEAAASNVVFSTLEAFDPALGTLMGARWGNSISAVNSLLVTSALPGPFVAPFSVGVEYQQALGVEGAGLFDETSTIDLFTQSSATIFSFEERPVFATTSDVTNVTDLQRFTDRGATFRAFSLMSAFSQTTAPSTLTASSALQGEISITYLYKAAETTVVPLPSALPLLLAGLGGIWAVTRRRHPSQAQPL